MMRKISLLLKQASAHLPLLGIILLASCQTKGSYFNENDSSQAHKSTSIYKGQQGEKSEKHTKDAPMIFQLPPTSQEQAALKVKLTQHAEQFSNKQKKSITFSLQFIGMTQEEIADDLASIGIADTSILDNILKVLSRDPSTLETGEQEALKGFKTEWKKSIQKIQEGQQNYQQLRNIAANQLGEGVARYRNF
jgi:hypothetical protein